MDKEIIKLQNTKAAIKQALIDKGCNPTDEFASYADNIREIQTSGNSYYIVDNGEDQIVFPEDTQVPFYVSNRFVQKEWNFPNVKQLLCFPVTEHVGSTTSSLITFNIPKCEKIYKVNYAKNVKFITSNKLTDLSYAFATSTSGSQFNSLEITDTSNVSDISYMFNSVCPPNDFVISLPKLENAAYAFKIPTFYSSKTINVTINDVVNPIIASYMFNFDNTINVYSNTTLRLIDANQMFYENATSIFPSISFEPDCSAVQMFAYCEGLTNIDMLQNTQNISDMQVMFGYCTNLENIPVTFSYENSNNFTGMYRNCTKLLYIPKVDNNKFFKWDNMFNSSGIIKVEEIFSGENPADHNETSIKHINSANNIRYIIVKNLGNSQDSPYSWSKFYHKADFSGWGNWGVEDESIQLSIGARQSLVDSLAVYSVDRVAKGYTSTYTISLSATTKSLLTQDEIAQITAKGFTIA